MFFKSKSYSLYTKQNSSHCRRKRVQSNIKYTLEDDKLSLETEDNEYCFNSSLRSNEQETLTVQQKKKIALNTFDEKKIYTDRYKSVSCGYNPNS